MKDHRYVDELTIAELEEVLRLRRRQERLKRMQRRPAAVDSLSKGEAKRNSTSQSTSEGETGSLWWRERDEATRRYSAVVERPKVRRRRQRRPIKWRWVRDQALLLVEVVAVVALVWIVVRMVTTVDEINEESRAIQTLPTVTPTPIIRAVVLPGGHTPPDADGQSAPAPVPVHLQDVVAEITPLPVPTPGPEHAKRIVIPALGVDAPVVEGDDEHALKLGAGHHIGSANPGERGNVVVSAHNDIYGEIFRDLPDLDVGDEIVVHTETTSYRYVMEQARIVEPDEVSVLAPTSSPVLTLISCYPYRVNTHRIVVVASMVVD